MIIYKRERAMYTMLKSQEQIRLDEGNINKGF